MKSTRENLVVLDVETTGLDPEHHSLTAIGVGIEGLQSPTVYFVDQPFKEKEAIQWLARKIRECGSCKVGSWRIFDVPFVRTRARIHKLSDPFRRASGFIDLHRFAVKRLKSKGEDMHLSDVARMLGLGEKLFPSEDMPALYARWLGGDKEARERIVMHCHRDVELELGVYMTLKEVARKFHRSPLARRIEARLGPFGNFTGVFWNDPPI